MKLPTSQTSVRLLMNIADANETLRLLDVLLLRITDLKGTKTHG